MKVYLVTTGRISPTTDSVHATLESAKARRDEIILSDMKNNKYKLTADWHPKIKTIEDLYKEESEYSDIVEEFVYGTKK